MLEYGIPQNKKEGTSTAFDHVQGGENKARQRGEDNIQVTAYNISQKRAEKEESHSIRVDGCKSVEIIFLRRCQKSKWENGIGNSAFAKMKSHGDLDKDLANFTFELRVLRIIYLRFSLSKLLNEKRARRRLRLSVCSEDRNCEIDKRESGPCFCGQNWFH